MHIEQKPPYVRRGVTQLMYVGDSDAVEKATSSYDLGKIVKWTVIAFVAMHVLGGITPPLPKLDWRSRRTR